jgi:hypothetical protein
LASITGFASALAFAALLPLPLVALGFTAALVSAAAAASWFFLSSAALSRLFLSNLFM